VTGDTTLDRRLSTRAQRLAAAAAAWPRGRIQLAELWRILDDADPATRTSSTRRLILADTLTELASAGVFTLPAAASWDRIEKPHLPRFVTVSTARPSDEPSRRVIWHPALAWVVDTRIAPTHRGYLEQINTWLHRHRDDTVVPLRERSLEIFGNEKVLDRLVLSTLFAPGRLSLALLKARRVAPRLTTETVGVGTTLLVVENSDTFDSLVHVLAANPGRVGLVGWGAGGAFEASVLSVPRLGPHLREIRYFGDLDARGLQIPGNAAALASSERIPAVCPATGLYEALLTHGQPQAGQPKLAPATARKLTDWLPADMRDVAQLHLTGGTRLAQEAIGLTLLTGDASWRRDLD
jgi:hypothetical protein